MAIQKVECGETTLSIITIEIAVDRYEELIAKEERLKLLEKAVINLPYSSQTQSVKDIFNIKEKEIAEV